MPTESLDLDELLDLRGNRTVVEYLIKQLTSAEGVVPVVGRGLSLAVGLTPWSHFLSEQAALAGLSDEDSAALMSSGLWEASGVVLARSTPLLFMDAVASEYGRHRFSKIEAFGAAAFLPFLTRNLVITSAIDKLLEVVFEKAGLPFRTVRGGKNFVEAGASGSFELVKPSGDADHPESLILTIPDRDQFWGWPPSFTGLDQMTSGVAGFRSLLFVGCFLTPQDPLCQIIQQKISGGARQIHYAIISSDAAKPQFRRVLAELNIRPICFPRNEYRLIGPLLAYLARRTNPDFRAPLESAASPGAMAEPESTLVTESGPSATSPNSAAGSSLSLPEPLADACATGECVVFVGSGLSARAGLPTWQRFVGELVDWSVAHQAMDPQNADIQRRALAEGEVNAVADNLVDLYERRQQKGLLLEFCRSMSVSSGPLPNAYNTLRRIPFSGMLTTNFDDLLWRTYGENGLSEVLTPIDSEKLHECLSKSRAFLLKLYGTLDRPETVIVAPAEYEAMLGSNVLFLKFMEALFFSRTLFFVGASLEGIIDYLRGFRFSGPVTRQHYALVAVNGTAWKAKAEVLARRYNINVIGFPASPDYPEVDTFLESLAGAVEVRRSARTSPQAGTPGRLLKVQLRNIGPFESLEIDLKANWMMLLGDNGVGKSSILKAIGVAVVGSEAREYASRIIRFGQSSASVTLITDRNPSGYLTEILKRDVDAEVVSRPSRPLEPENWVALGFPPLRTMSWATSQGPLPKGKGRPSPEDVLPLIRGEADPRLDKLKQWIVNLDSEDKKLRAEGQEHNAAARTLADFFKVVGGITEGFEVSRGEVTPDFRVLVTTPDGQIPIETLSQGLTSLYSWVGILLQRLYEVRDEQNATQSHALVLMDEIDAHMHPAWQQVLVPRLKAVFPNLQVIASTHSPLIVAGMSVEEITRLERSPEGKVVIRAVEADMTMGRADQLLTSGLFGLPTTMDENPQLQEYHELLVIPEARRTGTAQPVRNPAT
ncbi:MAG: SIR2 family protein [Verrucomicrobiota bacterium]